MVNLHIDERLNNLTEPQLNNYMNIMFNTTHICAEKPLVPHTHEQSAEQPPQSDTVSYITQNQETEHVELLVHRVYHHIITSTQPEPDDVTQTEELCGL